MIPSLEIRFDYFFTRFCRGWLGHFRTNAKIRKLHALFSLHGFLLGKISLALPNISNRASTCYLRTLHGFLLCKISHLLCPIKGKEQAHVYLRSLHGFLLGKISHLLCPIKGIEQHMFICALFMAFYSVRSLSCFAHDYLGSLHDFPLSKISLALPNRRIRASTCFFSLSSWLSTQ